MHAEYGDGDFAAFRGAVRGFFQRYVVPHYAEWENSGVVPREVWARAGGLGLIGMQVPPKYGGPGASSFRYSAAVTEEAHAAGVGFGGFRLQTDVCIPYLLDLGTEQQKTSYLPRLIAGETICAFALTEAEGGSDVRGIRTVAARVGDEYVVNGSKTFISNGSTAGLIIAVVKTDERGRSGRLSLLLIERGLPGFSSGRPLKKLGLHAQDTVELSFTDVRVPCDALLGVEGEGFAHLTSNLPRERLSIAVSAQASAEAAMRGTIAFVKERSVFGASLSSFQNTKFELAACEAEVRAGRALVEAAIDALDRGALTAADAAAAKLFCTEMQGRVLDRCLQLHGGQGYMQESAIARAYADARVSRIYGGSSEVMKMVIARSLGL